MQNVGPALRTALVTLASAAAAIALARSRRAPARREAVWLALLLAAIPVRMLAPRGGAADALIATAVLASSGSLLLAIHDRPGTGAWLAACAGFLALTLAVALPLGEPVAMPPAGAAHVRAAAYGLLGLFPLGLAVLLWRKTGEPVDLLLAIAALAWAAAGAVETALGASRGPADALAAPLVGVIAWTLVEQGYLSPLTSPGYVDRLAVHRRLHHESVARLFDTQRALEEQDRLVAAGLLALGASHEYRNVLAALRAVAGRGLACRESGGKDRCLRLVLDHATAGGETATALLERIGRAGREAATRVALRELLERLARTVRPVARQSGVRFVVEAGGGMVVRCRPGEVTQALLNLARNALEGHARGEGAGATADGVPLVRVVAHREGRRALVETLDNAGGVRPAQVPHLFRPGRSTRGGTGVGLYLARCLAERNGGTLTYRGIAGGSCFTLALPLAVGRPARARPPKPPPVATVPGGPVA